jgi:hypothetical protein
MRAFHLPKTICCWLLLSVVAPAEGMESPASAAAAVLADHSKDVVNLFNNMRTPAAMLTGGLVGVGVMSATPPQQDDTKCIKRLKKAHIMLGVASLLSEIMAVTYASIAINKLVEVPSPATAGVAELIQQHHELAWLGTNIHFLFGMMGFGLLIGNRVYLTFGNPIGQLALGLSVAFFLQALSVVNTGIAMGSGEGVNSRFASNLFFLSCRYISVAVQSATGGVCGSAAIIVAVLTIIKTAITFHQTPHPVLTKSTKRK